MHDTVQDAAKNTAHNAAQAAATNPRRFGARITANGRLYWWVEMLTIFAFYGIYSWTRNTNQGGTAAAFANARRLMNWQRAIGIFREEMIQDLALRARPFVIAMNYVYGSLHFVVTAGTIIYLFRRYADDYARWRNTLAITTTLALVGFMLWPLMPPRLLPEGYGFVDTLAKYPTFWSFHSGAISKASNQYAAMPSLHFAWSLFCACALTPKLQRRGARWAIIGYPGLTIVAIVVTGNHYILDAVAGAAIFGIAYAITRRLHGRHMQRRD